MYTIGIDIGGTSIRAGLLDENMVLHAFRRVPQADVLQGDAVEGLTQFIQAYIDDNLQGDASQVAAAAIGIPGTLDKTRSIVQSAPNVRGLDGLNLPALLSAKFPFPVGIEKDVSMLYYTDANRFGLTDECVVACYIGTGLGNAISIGGKLHTGSHGAAGELGHIPVYGSTAACGCGNAGCVECAVGGKRLARLQAELFPDTHISDLFAEHAAHPAPDAYIRQLAVPIATEVNILDPSVLILGGGVPSMNGFPQAYLEACVREHVRKPMPANDLRVIFSADDGTCGVMGAGLYARGLACGDTHCKQEEFK